MLLALHVVVFGGVDLGHPHVLVTAVSVDQRAHQASAVHRPTRGQSGAVACLAMLAGLLVVHATWPVTRRRRQLPAPRPPAAPVLTPPTRPPITLGISRS